jgi:hypothetical protein
MVEEFANQEIFHHSTVAIFQILGNPRNQLNIRLFVEPAHNPVKDHVIDVAAVPVPERGIVTMSVVSTPHRTAHTFSDWLILGIDSVVTRPVQLAVIGSASRSTIPS